MTSTNEGARPVPWPLPDNVAVVDVGGYPLAFRDVGEGPPLILIHGSLNDYRAWALQEPVLAKRLRVLAPSLRHYYPEPWDGRSGKFSLAQHASDIVAFVGALELESVHFLGHSRGGAVALLVGKHHPQLLRSLVLAEPRGLEDLLPNTPETSRLAAESDAIFAALHRDLCTGDVVTAARNFVDSFNGAGSWERRPERYKKELLDNLATAVDTGERPGVTCADIAAFDFPVLLVRGASGARRYAEGFAAMRACNSAISAPVVVPAAGHAMHRENPAAFSTAVLGFVTAVEAGTFRACRSGER